MDLAAFLRLLDAAQTPSLVLCLGALWWLARDRRDVLEQLKAATAEQLAYRDRRAQELQEAAREYAQYGEALRVALKDLREEVRRVAR